MKKELENTKSNISNQEQVNRELLNKLQRLQSEEIKDEEDIEGEVNQMVKSGGKKGKNFKKEGEQENDEEEEEEKNEDKLKRREINNQY